MSEYQSNLKNLKRHPTKEAWVELFTKYKQIIETKLDDKQLAELYKALKSDPAHSYYPELIWLRLFKACIRTWNLEIAQEIIASIKYYPSIELASFAAEILLEGGKPEQSRQLAKKTLRRNFEDAFLDIKLHILICRSYAEQSKAVKARRLIDMIIKKIDHAQSLEAAAITSFRENLARVYFFLGEYPAAARQFKQASEDYYRLEEFSNCARSLFNAAASLHNSSSNNETEAFSWLNQCQEIASKHQLQGALSHCLAFKGTHLYQTGRFQEAISHFHRALKSMPAHEQSFRRLHILSMLTLAYFSKGRYPAAYRYAQQTQELAEKDASQRFHTRYATLDAELHWQLGNYQTALGKIKEVIQPIQLKGVTTLEELYSASRYLFYNALIGKAVDESQIEVNKSLKNHKFAWLDFQLSLTELYLSKGKLKEAKEIILENLEEIKETDSVYFRSLILLQNLELHLASDQLKTESFHSSITELDSLLKNQDCSRLRAQYYLIKSAIDYREGKFSSAISFMEKAGSMLSTPSNYLLIIDSCLKGMRGKITTTREEIEQASINRFVSLYFKPTIQQIDFYTFTVGQHYQVCLKNQPILAETLNYLLSKRSLSASPSELQQKVWKQSLQTQGWQQKIRNTNLRLRSAFCYCIQTPILHGKDIHLNTAVIEIKAKSSQKSSLTDRIIQLLESTPSATFTSQLIASNCQASLSTTKRTLRKLIDSGLITLHKQGREISYQTKSQKGFG